tara:strand:- start:10 stop:198 length:189 start_codon:yes stop_codon:yes gene_type:complete
MTTTLYAATFSMWIELLVFTGGFQINECREKKEKIESTYEVELFCVTKMDRFLVVNQNVYRR